MVIDAPITDSNNDGYHDAANSVPLNSDFNNDSTDIIPDNDDDFSDYIDLDSDNDGCTDQLERGNPLLIFFLLITVTLYLIFNLC